MDTSQHGKGGLLDRPDPRDFQFRDVARAGVPFDWGVGFDIETKVGLIPTKDQGASYSCGGQAWSYYTAVLEALFSHSMEVHSAKYIYAQTFVAPNGGSQGRDNCELCIKQGCADEVLCTSYQGTSAPSEAFMRLTGDITAEARTNAKLSQSLSYASVVSNIDLFAQSIRDNGGLVLGIDGEDNGTWLSTFPKPPTTARWAHWLYAGKAKMINGKKFIGVKNSWGDSVGDHGWQWIGEEYFNSGHVWYGWTLQFKTIVNNKYVFTRDMRYGDRSEDVRQLQLRLGIPVATGYFGDQTRAAVIAYQDLKGVKLTFAQRYWKWSSVVGPSTRASLNT